VTNATSEGRSPRSRARDWARDLRGWLWRRKAKVIAGLVVLFHVLGLLGSVHAVMTARTAQGAIAWAVSLNTFPYVAVPAYWVFGRRKFEGYVERFQEHDEQLRQFVQEFRSRLAPYEIAREERVPDYEALKTLARSPLLGRNDVELLIDGEATFDSIIEGIGRARESVLVEFYIVRDDGLGRRLQQALIAKAREGVRVLFLYDEIGSHGLTQAYRTELQEAGAEISAFNTTQGRRNRFQLNFRNHRKIVVVDGAEAWIGGHNVGDDYLSLYPKTAPWRDTHVHLIGPVALLAQLTFAGDWYWATEELVSLGWEPQPAETGDTAALVLASGPADRLETAQLFFVHALNAAKDRIWIATPYFVPDEAVMTALQLATLRGVDVRVILPKKPDSYAVWLASFWYIEELADDDVRFYHYEEGFMHQKVMLVDDYWSAVGTANFDNRSFRLNFEVTAVVADRPFAKEMEAMLEADMERSVPFDPSRLKEMGFFRRLAVRTARLLSPIL
jgi:cardiolipin synthase